MATIRVSAPMNRFEATVTEIVQSGSLHIVTFESAGQPLSMMSLELGAEVRVGVRVVLTIKSTTIALAKSFEGQVSYTNLLPATVRAIRWGELLCSVTLHSREYDLESIITAASARQMDLAESDQVTMLLNSSELSIVEVLS